MLIKIGGISIANYFSGYFIFSRYYLSLKFLKKEENLQLQVSIASKIITNHQTILFFISSGIKKPDIWRNSGILLKNSKNVLWLWFFFFPEYRRIAPPQPLKVRCGRLPWQIKSKPLTVSSQFSMSPFPGTANTDNPKGGPLLTCISE